MAVSPPEARWLLLAVALLAPIADAASPRAAARAARGNDIVLESGPLEVDTQSGKVRLTDKVTITQGALRIESREAEARGTEPNFSDARWDFRGGVRIDFEGGSLTADLATVTFARKRIVRFEAQGSPAQFEQKLEKSPEPARGRADRIDYNVGSGLVVMTGNTWFTYTGNEYRSESISYSVAERRLKSGGATPQNPDGNGRIRIIIRPDDEAAPTAPTPP